MTPAGPRREGAHDASARFHDEAIQNEMALLRLAFDAPLDVRLRVDVARIR